MDCGCVYVGDPESPSFWKITNPIARKNHFCSECQQIIKKNEEYKKEEGIWDGEWQVFKICSTCLIIRDVFFCEGYVLGSMFEYLREYLRVEFDNDLPYAAIEELGEISIPARDKVLTIIDDIWED